LYFSGELDAAVATAQKSIEINPSHPYSRPVLAVVLARQGRLAEAETIAHATLEQHPTEFLMNAAVGVMYAIANDAQRLSEANERAQAIRAPRAPLNVNVAVHYAFLGRADYAREWLQKAVREGMHVDIVVKHNPLLRQFASEFPARSGRRRRLVNGESRAAVPDVDQGDAEG
jgi:Flp pilus assembly protein TadD